MTRLPEDESQLLVVVGHGLRHGRLLGQVHETVDVLDGLVGFLPQLHLDGRVELHQTSVLVQLLRLGLGNAHVGDLRRQLLDVLEMLAQLVAQLAELSLAVVF